MKNDRGEDVSSEDGGGGKGSDLAGRGSAGKKKRKGGDTTYSRLQVEKKDTFTWVGSP